MNAREILAKITAREAERALETLDLSAGDGKAIVDGVKRAMAAGDWTLIFSIRDDVVVGYGVDTWTKIATLANVD